MGARRGSALLIVLGFLSFMVVSAVAFSIYMRSERVPSSVFRRNVSVRHLMQAGLARAMSELDDAIRDNPFPGVIKNPEATVKYMTQANYEVPANPPYAGLPGNRRYVDWWFGRVFMPPNPDDEKDGRLLAPEGDTVSTVNLEGLGYVPPPLINDVRFLSRRTWTAKWRGFDYGMGRFAYCAVNLSDYLDINRMLIAEPRTGFRRISLAPLFSSSGSDRLDIDQTKITKFKSFVAGPGSDSDGAQGSWQLVSMLDYALAGRDGANGFQSDPFYNWITKSSKIMYPNQGSDDARRQVFVTDSWFPPSYKEKSRPTLDIDAMGNERGQPFDLGSYNDMTKARVSLEDLLNNSFPANVVSENGASFDNKSSGMFSGTEIATLYDYIDRDDIPTSLALPVVERNPMVVAISPGSIGLNLNVPAQPLNQASAASTPVSTMVNFDNMGGFRDVAESGFNVVLAYPFKHNDVGGVDLANATYQVQAVVKIFFVRKDAAVGTRGRAFGASYANAVFRPSDSDYTGSSSYANNIVTLVSKPTSVSFSGEDNMAKDVVITFQPLANPVPLVEHVSTWVPAKVVNNVETESAHAESSWNLQFFPIDLEAKAVIDGTGIPTLPTDEIVPVMVVWVRVKDVNRDFVADCAPATFFEDTFNGITANQHLCGGNLSSACGGKEPLLRFTCKADAPAFQFSGLVNGAGPFTTTVDYKPGAQEWLQRGIYAVDPRYNHAPEDWCMDIGNQIDRDRWENLASSASGMDGADGDLYFFVSNQGFLQSMGELAFLPRVKDNFCMSMGSDLWGSRWKRLRGNEYLSGVSEYAEAVGAGLADMVYRTYEPWDNTTGGDNLFGCGIADATSGGYINPYSDSVEVLTAALANTPVNWWAAAGTNTVKDASKGQNANDTVSKRRSSFIDLKESLKFAFNEEGSAGSEDRELKYKALRNLAAGMKNAFREGVQANKTWEQIYDDWNWTPTGTPFSWAGSEFTDQLDAIDCRYLYSFWRGCFANRQQLFLVFVRAESMALGGSGEGQIPPQQGGRAVALVWRDPETPQNSNDAAQANDRKPHRMRTLFYHQLD